MYLYCIIRHILDVKIIYQDVAKQCCVSIAVLQDITLVIYIQHHHLRRQGLAILMTIQGSCDDAISSLPTATLIAYKMVCCKMGISC